MCSAGARAVLDYMEHGTSGPTPGSVLRDLLTSGEGISDLQQCPGYHPAVDAMAGHM